MLYRNHWPLGLVIGLVACESGDASLYSNEAAGGQRAEPSTGYDDPEPKSSFKSSVKFSSIDEVLVEGDQKLVTAEVTTNGKAAIRFKRVDMVYNATLEGDPAPQDVPGHVEETLGSFGFDGGITQTVDGGTTQVPVIDSEGDGVGFGINAPVSPQGPTVIECYLSGEVEVIPLDGSEPQTLFPESEVFQIQIGG